MEFDMWPSHRPFDSIWTDLGYDYREPLACNEAPPFPSWHEDYFPHTDVATETPVGADLELQESYEDMSTSADIGSATSSWLLPASPSSGTSKSERFLITKVDGRWQCPVQGCTCSYRHKGDLKFHALRKHKEIKSLASAISKNRTKSDKKRLCCPIPGCNAGFDWRQNLSRHLKAAHNTTKTEALRRFTIKQE